MSGLEVPDELEELDELVPFVDARIVTGWNIVVVVVIVATDVLDIVAIVCASEMKVAFRNWNPSPLEQHDVAFSRLPQQRLRSAHGERA